MSKTPVRFALALGLVLASGLSAFAQTPAKPGAAAATPPAFSPFGDAKRFTQFSGWGGFGGAIGQFGMAKAMLVNTPAVQEELKLKDDQKKALREWSEALRKRGETMMRPPAQGEDRAGGNEPAQTRPGPGFNPFAMLDMVTTLVREGETSLAQILTKAQTKRLAQIALQMEGLSALAREDVAVAVNMSPEQLDAVRQILNETKGNQIAFMMGQMMTFRGGRPRRPGESPEAEPAVPRPAPKPDAPEPTAKRTSKSDAKSAKAEDPDAKSAKTEKAEDPEAEAKGRQAAREQMQARFTKMREGTDQIQNTSVAKLTRVLNKKQRERFIALLGKPFDANKLNGPGGFGGPPGSRAPALSPSTADAAATSKTATPPVPRTSRLRDLRSGEKKTDQ